VNISNLKMTESMFTYAIAPAGAFADCVAGASFFEDVK
jgi:hypothetical protein